MKSRSNKKTKRQESDSLVKRWCVNWHMQEYYERPDGDFVRFKDFDAQRLRADTAEAAFKSLREELSQVHMQQLCDLTDEWQQRLTDEKTGASGIYQQLEICQKQRDHLKQRIAKLEGCLRQIYSASEWTSNSFHYKEEAQKLAYAALKPNPEAESHADDL